MPSDSSLAEAKHLRYLDFELEIGPGSGRDYPVAVVRSPAGEARETMHFPFDELALENHLNKLQIALLRSGGNRRRIPSPEEQTVQGFGQALFNALLTGEVRSRYDVSQREAVGQNKGLRLKLRIRPPELAALPWEFIYDSRQAEYVCLSRSTPVVRYLELPQLIQPLTVTLPLRILGMITCPSDLPSLDVTREKQRMEKAIKGLRTRRLVELTWLDGQTWRDLQRAMRSGPWHAFHFIGHGGFDRNADEGLVALADEQGQSYCLNATQLGRLLADHSSLRLVLLNACEGARGSKHDIFSSTASILVRRGIPAVLAMQYEITDQAAIEFSRAFYEAVADEMPADAAVAEARKAVSMAVTNTIEWGTPVLYMRSPDGVLFNLTSTSKLAALPERLKETVTKKQEGSERQAQLAAEKAEAKQLEQERQEREARERAAKEEAERKVREEAAQREVVRQAKLAAEKAEAERLERERQDREARERAAEEAERKARKRESQKKTVAWGGLRRLPLLAWARPLALLVLIGVLIGVSAVWFVGNSWKFIPVPTVTALEIVTKPSLTPLGVTAQPVIATSTFTPTPMPSSTLAATPTLTPTPTPTPSKTLTSTPSKTPTSTPPRTPTPTPMPTPTWTASPANCQNFVPIASQSLAPPQDGHYYRNPITFKWNGLLRPGQTYQVKAQYSVPDWPPLVVAQSGLLNGTTWTTNINDTVRFGGKTESVEGRVSWFVYIVCDGRQIYNSALWDFYFSSRVGNIQPPPP
jgi:hypothetical protein